MSQKVTKDHHRSVRSLEGSQSGWQVDYDLYDSGEESQPTEEDYQPSEEESQTSPIDIFVIIQGHPERYSFRVYETDTVQSLKAELYRKSSISPDEQELIYTGKRLTDSRRLEEYHISTNATIHCVEIPSQGVASSSLATSARPSKLGDRYLDDHYFDPLSHDISHSRDGSRSSSKALPLEMLYDNRPYHSRENLMSHRYESSGPPLRRHHSPSRFPSGASVSEAHRPSLKLSNQLQQGGPRSSSNILAGDSSSSNHIIETPFLSPDETYERLKCWRERATEDNCEPDLHIVDPIAYRSHLDMLEDSVVRNSEFFICNGNLDCEDSRLPTLSLEDFTFFDLDLRLRPVFDDYRGAPSWVLDNLLRSYYILCKTLKSFDRLHKAQFCSSFYSVLVQSSSKSEARLARLPREHLIGLKRGLQTAILRIYNDHPDGSEQILLDFVATSCDLILESSGLLPESTETSISIIGICRATVLLLDLALVSYVGSHGLLFTSHIGSNVEYVQIRSQQENMPQFNCSLKRLACLAEFLDNTQVWVFSFEERGVQSAEGLPGLSVLTRMEEFADIWGPVWAVPLEGQSATRIRQYNLSRGCIRPMYGKPSHDLITCHWYSKSYPPNNPAGEQEDLSMGRDDLLLIGMALQENRECLYDLEHFEDDFGQTMGILGTVPDSWPLDTRTLGFSAGQYVGIVASGTQKRSPGVTLKENIWNMVSQSPRQANIPQFLNMYVGVQVSHCSGNARRVRLVDILRMPRVQDRLSQIRPDWEMTAWGQGFLEALNHPDFDVMRRFWRQLEIREDVGKLLAPLLQLLHLTGRQGDQFVAAYFAQYDDRHLELPIAGNEWARCLHPSPNSATYAVIAECCLKSRTQMDNEPAICTREASYTALQTRILFKDELPLRRNLIRIDSVRDTYRIDRIRRSKITLLASDVLAATRLLQPWIKGAQEIMSTIGSRRTQKEFSTMITASRESLGGMSRARHVILPQDELLPERRLETQIVPVEIAEPLRTQTQMPPTSFREPAPRVNREGAGRPGREEPVGQDEGREAGRAPRRTRRQRQQQSSSAARRAHEGPANDRGRTVRCTIL